MFISVPIIHQNNIEADTTIHFKKDEIFSIAEATALDKKHRTEVKAIIQFKSGMTYATSLSAEELIQMCQ